MSLREKMMGDAEYGIQWVDAVVGFIIIINTAVIGISCDVDPHWIGWVILDGFFAAAFLLELVIKVCVLGPRQHFLGPDAKWSWLDLFFAMSALFELCIG